MQSIGSVNMHKNKDVSTDEDGYLFMPSLLPFVGFHINSALMLSLGISQQIHASDTYGDGYWDMSAKEWTRLTGIKRMAQESARNTLRKTGVWHERVYGYPARRQTKIDLYLLSSKLKKIHA